MFGSESWGTMVLFAIFGFIVAVVGGVYGIYWAFKHITILVN